MGKFVVLLEVEFNAKTCGPCSQVEMPLNGGYFCRLFRVNLRGEGKPERCIGCKEAEEQANGPKDPREYGE